MTDVRSSDRLSEAEAAGVLGLASAAGEADGVYPLSEDVVLRVRNVGYRFVLPPKDSGGDRERENA